MRRKDIHVIANGNAIDQAVFTPTKIQTTILNLGVVKIRLYIRRTLTLVIPNAGHGNIPRTNNACVYVLISYHVTVMSCTW